MKLPGDRDPSPARTTSGRLPAACASTSIRKTVAVAHRRMLLPREASARGRRRSASGLIGSSGDGSSSLATLFFLAFLSFFGLLVLFGFLLVRCVAPASRRPPRDSAIAGRRDWRCRPADQRGQAGRNQHGTSPGAPAAAADLRSPRHARSEQLDRDATAARSVTTIATSRRKSRLSAASARLPTTTVRSSISMILPCDLRSAELLGGEDVDGHAGGALLVQQRHQIGIRELRVDQADAGLARLRSAR